MCICLLSFLSRYTGGDWITLVQGGGSASWEVRVKGNLSPRPDNGRINSSPTTAVSPVFRLRHGATHTITIPGKEKMCKKLMQSFPQCIVFETYPLWTQFGMQICYWFGLFQLYCDGLYVHIFL